MSPQCIGFGPYEGTCPHDAGPRNEALLWCDRCEDLRREHISAQFETIAASFAASDDKEPSA